MNCNGELLDNCRIGLYAQSDIIEFTPSSGDLAYPEKLEMMKAIEKEHTLEKVITFFWYPNFSVNIVQNERK